MASGTSLRDLFLRSKIQRCSRSRNSPDSSSAFGRKIQEDKEKTGRLPLRLFSKTIRQNKRVESRVVTCLDRSSNLRRSTFGAGKNCVFPAPFFPKAHLKSANSKQNALLPLNTKAFSPNAYALGLNGLYFSKKRPLLQPSCSNVKQNDDSCPRCTTARTFSVIEAFRIVHSLKAHILCHLVKPALARLSHLG